jgi:F0F1-type ATP synthase membrane subunit b/b'
MLATTEEFAEGFTKYVSDIIAQLTEGVRRIRANVEAQTAEQPAGELETASAQ